jgi:uncharacterized membrane protein
MTPGLFGAISAGCLGTADFMGRLSSRAMGHHNALLGVLSIGVAVLTLRMVLAGEARLPTLGAYGWLVTNGVATTAMTLLLYLGLARGPVSVVAPIVAAHPVLVVLYYATTSGIAPGAFALAAMAWTILGTVIVARWADGEAEQPALVAAGAGIGGHAQVYDDAGVDEVSRLRKTVMIAIGSSIAYAVLIIAGQAAAPVYGEMHTLWYGRIVSLATLLAVFAYRGTAPHMPMRWWPFLGAQGLLDAGGYMALFAGSTLEGREIAAIVASTFGAVTVLLARIVLKERVAPVQWFGIALVFAGVVVLSVPH